MKSFQIINLTKNYLRNVRNAGAAQTGSEENNKSKRVCVKFSLQSESDCCDNHFGLLVSNPPVLIS